jgi:hypothetical protein
MLRCLGHDRVEVGVRKPPVVLDAREEPEEGRCVRDVQGLRLAGTAGEEATDAAMEVSDDRTRIAGGGEDSGLVVVGEDSPLHRRPVSVTVEVLADVGEDASSAAYGDAGGVVVLYDQEARFTVVIKRIWVAHQVFRNDIPKPEEAVIWILEGRGGGRVRAHL